MDIHEAWRNIVNHWDEGFKNLEIQPLRKEDFDAATSFSRAIIELADTKSHILDIGTGSGRALFVAKFFGRRFQTGTGIDPSTHAIQALKKACAAADMDDLTFIQGDHHTLKSYPDCAFDGIICSNVLDVLPKPISQTLIAEIKRLLCNDGMLVLKLNFYLTDALIEKLKMRQVDDHTYAMNGVIRGLNFSSEAWIEMFKPLVLIKTDTYPRIKEGPLDRLFVFKKTT